MLALLEQLQLEDQLPLVLLAPVDAQHAALQTEQPHARHAMPISSFRLVPVPPVLPDKPQLEEHLLLVLPAQLDAPLAVLQAQQLHAKLAVLTLDLPQELVLLALLDKPHLEESLSALPAEMAARPAQQLEPL